MLYCMWIIDFLVVCYLRENSVVASTELHRYTSSFSLEKLRAINVTDPVLKTCSNIIDGHGLSS